MHQWLWNQHRTPAVPGIMVWPGNVTRGGIFLLPEARPDHLSENRFPRDWLPAHTFIPWGWLPAQPFICFVFSCKFPTHKARISPHFLVWWMKKYYFWTQSGQIVIDLSQIRLGKDKLGIMPLMPEQIPFHFTDSLHACLEQHPRETKVLRWDFDNFSLHYTYIYQNNWIWNQTKEGIQRKCNFIILNTKKLPNF